MACVIKVQCKRGEDLMTNNCLEKLILLLDKDDPFGLCAALSTVRAILAHP